MKNFELTAANLVTIGRLILVVPYLVYLFIVKNDALSSPQQIESVVITVGTFVVISLLDLLDGYLARSRNEVTNFGKIADPIADKLLIIGVLVILNITLCLPIWVTALVIFRELFITIFRAVVIKRNGKVIAASGLGKLKTFTQTSAIIGFLLPLTDLPVALTIIAWTLMGLALVLTYISAIEYVVKGLK